MLQNIRRAKSGITERREEAQQQHRKAAEAGFTLIELLIVIVILGILAAVVVFSVQGIQNKGQAAACKSDVASVTTASEAYYAQNGSYTDVDGLVSAKLLHSAPSTVQYVISVDKTTGAVSVSATGATGTALDATALADCQSVAK